MSASACSPSARAASRATRSRRTWRLKPGMSFSIAGYDFRFVSAADVRGTELRCGAGAWSRSRAAASRDDARAAEAPFLGAADRQQSGGDLGELGARSVRRDGQSARATGAWSMRIQYKPLVRYIWLGAIVMAVGGVVAATDRRYRVRVEKPHRPIRCRRRRRPSRASDRPDVEVPLAGGGLRRARRAVRIRPQSRTATSTRLPSPLIGKPAPLFNLTDVMDPSRIVEQRSAQGPGLRAERLGHLVRRLPRRSTRRCSPSPASTWCRIIGLDYMDQREKAQAVAHAARQSLSGGRLRHGRAHGDRLGRVRCARDLSGRRPGTGDLQIHLAHDAEVWQHEFLPRISAARRSGA